MSGPGSEKEGVLLDNSGLALVGDPGYSADITPRDAAEMTEVDIEDAERAWRAAANDCHDEALEEVKRIAAEVQVAAEKFGCTPKRVLAAVQRQLLADADDFTQESRLRA